MDDAAHQTDAGLARRLGLGSSPSPVHALGVVVPDLLGRRTPSVQRDLGQDGEVGPTVSGLGQAFLQALGAIGLPVDLRDERNGELAVGARGVASVIGWAWLP